jgi:hypothetical protein
MLENKIKALECIAEGLKDRLIEFVFVGGAVTELYSSRSLVDEYRPTTDVDCITLIHTRSQYYRMEDYLRSMGFRNDIESGVICRWVYKGILVDVMPTDPKILGFSNKWYEDGFNHLVPYILPSGISINLFAAPWYVATKTEAVLTRGNKDLRADEDFEDIVFLFNNRNEMMGELRTSSRELKTFLAESFSLIVQNLTFHEGIFSVLPVDTAARRTPAIKEFINEVIIIGQQE